MSDMPCRIKWKAMLWFPISILAAGCVSTEKRDPSEATHFVIEEATPVLNTDPMPALYPFYVQVYAKKELVERRLGFRGWDIDKDGKIDMIETLDRQGQVVHKSYNFDKKQ